MLQLLTKITAEAHTYKDQWHPTHHWRPQIILQNLDSHIKTHHNQHIKQRGDKKISNGQGSLTSATTASNFRTQWKCFFIFGFLSVCCCWGVGVRVDCQVHCCGVWNTVTQCSICFEFMMSCMLHYYQNKDLSQSKDKHKPTSISVAIGDSGMWKESWT